MPRSTQEDHVDPRLPTRVLAAVVLLAIFALSLSSYVAMTRSLQYQGRDEGPNAAYAIELANGNLPVIGTKVTDEAGRYPQIVEGKATMEDEAHREIWTANHPPLYYLVSTPLVIAADELRAPQLLIVGMRLINALGTALGVLLVGLIAFELCPRRPAVAFLATGIAASCAILVLSGGHLSNDGLAAAFSSLTLLGTLRILRRGPTWPRLALVAVAGAAAAGTKAPGVLTVVVCGAAIVLVLLVRDRSRRGVVRALVAGAVATGVPAAATAWFYVRNIVLYGDPTASGALLEKYGRESVGTWQVLTDGQLWMNWFDGLWVLDTLPDVLRFGVRGLGIAALAGLVIALVRRLRADRKSPVPSAAGWLLLIAHALLTYVNLIGFVADGGNSHQRYLMPLLPLIATTLAVGLMNLSDLVPVGRREPRSYLVAAVLAGGFGIFGFAILYWFVNAPDYIGRLPNSDARGGDVVVALGVVAGVAGVGVAMSQTASGAVGRRRLSQDPRG